MIEINETIDKTINVLGVDVEITASYAGEYGDHGNGSYEFWGAVGCHTAIGWSCVADDTCTVHELTATVRQYLIEDGFNRINRKRYLKAVRRLVRKITKKIHGMTGEDFLTDDEMWKDAEKHTPSSNEPDCCAPDELDEREIEVHHG